MTEFRRLAISDIVEITPPRHGDDRGYFCEVYKRSTLAEKSILIDWIQDNQSFSADAGTVRGLHFQAPPVAQDKLIRVLRGAIYDVAVDIRRGSPTYGKWVARELTAEKGNQLLVPAGFAHGFMTLVGDTEVLYKVSAPWSPEHERAILWSDPTLRIDWPDVGRESTLSEKDRDAPSFADSEPGFSYGAAP